MNHNVILLRNAADDPEYRDGCLILKSTARDAADEIERLRAQVAALEAERDALLADAERYRWLRSVPTAIEAKRIVNDTPEGMDAAIDAARGAP